jgi:hypothetical protein
MERIDEWMAAARADLELRKPDPMIEHRLLARMRERQALRSVAATQPARTPARARPMRRWLWLGAPALAAALGFVVLMIGFSRPDAIDAPVLRATPFFALASAEAIAAERAPIVVESAVPRMALADYGLPVDPARVDEAVGAEFLLSRAGVILAVRFKE